MVWLGKAPQLVLLGLLLSMAQQTQVAPSDSTEKTVFALLIISALLSNSC